MSTRRVRGDSGAVFEVDASMLDVSATPERGYREPSAPPPLTRIVAPRRTSERAEWAWPRRLLLVSCALVLAFALARVVRVVLFG